PLYRHYYTPYLLLLPSNPPAPPNIYPLSLHDALPIYPRAKYTFYGDAPSGGQTQYCQDCAGGPIPYPFAAKGYRYLKYEYYDKQDRKSTRLNSSHDQISYAVFCLKKKKKKEIISQEQI